MKLLFQSDDYGFTDAITDGILKGITEGIIRNTGLFVNMPSSERAAKLIKGIENISVGIDINLVAGYPVTKNHNEIKSLIREDGHFIRSTEQLKKNNNPTANSIEVEFDNDPYVYDEVYLETENQVKRYIELMGRKPDYIHPHSLVTKNSIKAICEVAKKYDLFFSGDMMRSENIHMLKSDWTPKPFPIEAQSNTDVESNLYKALSDSCDKEVVCFICHCGYVDDDLLNESTYSLIRCKDLVAATSQKIIDFIEDNEIELITYANIQEVL